MRGWEALAHCYWKKGDLAAARDCLLQGIARVSFFNLFVCMA